MKNENHDTLNTLLFFGGAFLAFINFYTALTVLPLYVVELGGDVFDTGLQTTIYYLASILMRFYFGPLTDRRGRKLPLLIGAFAFGTAPLLFLLCDSVGALTLARIYHAVGLAAFFSSGGSLVADIAPAKRVGIYMGIYRVIFTLALLSGPSTALFVININNFDTWFLISFIIGIASMLLISLVKTPKTVITGSGGIFSSLSGFSEVLKKKAVRPIFFGIALASIGYGVLLTFCVLFIGQVTDVSNPGFYFTCFSLVGVLGSLGAGHMSDRFGRPVVVWPAVVLLGSGVASLYYLPQFPVIFFISSILSGIGFSGGAAVLAAWLVDSADPKNRGTVLALQESTIDFGIGLGSFVFGSITGWIGMAESFFVIGAASVVPAVFLLVRHRRKTN